MTEEVYLRGLIRDNLDLVKLLKAQPEVDDKEIDDILWHVLGLAIELDDMYVNQIKELDNRNVVTIKEELFKRQEIVELSSRREEIIATLFDKENPEENKLADLFEDMHKQNRYETTFYESDLKLVQEQLDARKRADEKVNALRAERINVEHQIESIEESLIPFEEFNASLNEDYERFVRENKIDEIDREAAEIERLKYAERQNVIDLKRKYAQTAKDIVVDDHIFALSENEVALHEANEKIFLCELKEMFKEEVNSYEELVEKTKKIHKYVLGQEQANAKICDFETRNKLSYRTMAFAFDVRNTEYQLNAPKHQKNIDELQARLLKIDEEIEKSYDEVKGRTDLDDIINNRKSEYPQEEKEEINEVPVADTNEMEPEVIAEDEVEPIKEVANEETLEEDEFKVVKKEKAKPTLLQKIKDKYRDVLDKIGKLDAQDIKKIIVAGSLSILVAHAAQFANVAATTQPTDVTSSPAQVEMVEKTDQASPVNIVEEQAEEAVYSPTIGDKIHVGEGVKYYRDAQSAQLNKQVYVTGKSGLNEGDYNVNRIALLARDADGKPTGKIIDVNTTPNVSAEALSESLGLPKGNYDVVAHISNGDYVEADKNARGKGDLCWIPMDEENLKEIGLVKSAEEVLENNMERGMSK